MIMYLYATKNKKSGDFGKLSTELYNCDQIKDLYINSVKEAPEKQRVYLEELELYCLGSLDTQTGDIKSEKTFLIDLGSVVHGETNKEVE